MRRPDVRFSLRDFDPMFRRLPGRLVKPHPLAVLACDDPEAVVLDLVQPRLAGQRLRCPMRHGAMKPAGRAREDMGEGEIEDPDRVVLSACNTIAGDKPGAEALSGLARAFFYAGARALLVSHWAVDSNAAMRLTTSTFDMMKSDHTVGRAEALRRAMLAYIMQTS